jgi:hypothetical protein
VALEIQYLIQNNPKRSIYGLIRLINSIFVFETGDASVSIYENPYYLNQLARATGLRGEFIETWKTLDLSFRILSQGGMAIKAPDALLHWNAAAYELLCRLGDAQEFETAKAWMTHWQKLLAQCKSPEGTYSYVLDGYSSLLVRLSKAHAWEKAKELLPEIEAFFNFHSIRHDIYARVHHFLIVRKDLARKLLLNGHMPEGNRQAAAAEALYHQLILKRTVLPSLCVTLIENAWNHNPLPHFPLKIAA